MFEVNDQVICTSKIINNLTYNRVYTVRWVSGSRIVVNDDAGCGFYYSKEYFKKVEKDNVENIKKLHKDIKNIYFNEAKKTTVIVFKNGDKVKATASKDTPFSEYAGFVTALFKYEHGLKLDDVEHLIKKKRG